MANKKKAPGARSDATIPVRCSADFKTEVEAMCRARNNIGVSEMVRNLLEQELKQWKTESGTP